MLRNRHAGDVASCSALGIEDQVWCSRPAPQGRRGGVRTFPRDATESLLKAMAQEDIAALLNNMAPDDRTSSSKRCRPRPPAPSLLTPAERSVALTLRLSERWSGAHDAHYVAVREHWSVQEVLTTCATTARTARR
jgi:Mg/Co/Ni transporter MgtE